MPEKRWRPRTRGSRAAAMLATKMMRGQKLSPHKEEMTRAAARLLVHFQNASNKLYSESEWRDDGEPKALLGRLLDLSRESRELMTRVFPDAEPVDPFAQYRERQP